MWKIKHIFDGDYGCEERNPNEAPKVSVTLINEDNEANHKLVLPSTSMSISFVKMLIFISETDIITKEKYENTFLLLEV